MPAVGPLRIGCVKYLNARPLIYGWPGEVLFDHPANLCAQLADGALDLALVSSFEFLRNPIYTIVDDVSLSSDGPVHSVFLAHTGALDEIEEIELDPASETSVNLLHCLLADKGLTPKFWSARGDSAIGPKRAKLFIGDQAIRFREQHAADCRFWDLGGEWRRAAGLPFVYALWLIRPGVECSKEIADQLRACRDKNLTRLDELAAAEEKFPARFCAYYWRECLRYRFAEREKEGLLHFRKLCEQHSILPPNTAPLHVL